MELTNSREAARAVLRRLRQDGHLSYFVGGCVRDRLLGRPVADYDIATSARPEDVVRLFPGSRLVGASFGVVLVDAHGVPVEVATFRCDHSYQDGRRPQAVSFQTDPGQDALRRDFTVNALMEDPESGEILDFAGGKKDLEGRLIRAIGDPDARFREDHLRMLRAVRLAASLGFDVEAGTMDAIRRNAERIRDIAPERVRDELVRILTEGSARRGMELLDSSGLLVHILPEVSAMKGVPQPPEHHPEGDVWNHTLLLLEKLRDPDPVLALAALLHDVGKPVTYTVEDHVRFPQHDEEGAKIARHILERLRFPTQEIQEVTALVRMHMRFAQVRNMRESKLKRFLRAPDFARHLELHRLDCEASGRPLENYEFCCRKLAELGQEQLHPERLINGNDLIREGYVPGPRFGVILAAVEDEQLEGRLHSKEEALAWVRERFPKPSS